MERISKLWTERPNERLGKILVNEQSQATLGRDNQTAPFSLSGVEQAGSDIILGKLRKLAQQFAFRHRSERTQDVPNGEAGSANRWLAEPDLRIHCDSLK